MLLYLQKKLTLPVSVFLPSLRPLSVLPPFNSSCPLPPPSFFPLFQSQTNPKNPRIPPIAPSAPQPPTEARVTTSSLLSLLCDLERNPSSPPNPSSEMAAVLAGDGLLVVDGTREDLEEVARRLMEAVNSLEGGVAVASWILKVTEVGRREEGVKVLVYCLINALLSRISSFQPRPHPAPLLQFLLSNQARLRLTFNPSQNPLIKLPEIYAKLYTQPKNPQYLVAIRAIHHAMKEADKDVFSIRSCNAILEAYGQARALEDDEIRGRGGS